MRVSWLLVRVRIISSGRKELDDMSRKMASFKAKKMLGVTNDEVFRRAVALHSTLFGSTLAASLKPDVASAKPSSPRRANTKPATGGGASSDDNSGYVVYQKGVLVDTNVKSMVDAGGEQKRKQQKPANPPQSSSSGADERTSKKFKKGCFRCGATDHFFRDCPQAGKSS